MNLTSEYMSIYSECQLFRKLPERLKKKIDRSVYNRRKRKLFFVTEIIRRELSLKFTEYEDYYIVDSMPLEVAKLSRSLRSKIYKEAFYSSPDIGYCASQHMRYYGYKIHAICSVDGIS